MPNSFFPSKLRLVMATLLGLVGMWVFCAPGEPSSFSFQLFYTGRITRDFESCDCAGIRSGGLLRRSGWVRWGRATHPKMFLLDGGFAPLEEGRQAEMKLAVYEKALEKMGYDVYCDAGRKHGGADLFSPRQIRATPLPQIIFPGAPPIGFLSLYTIALASLKERLQGTENHFLIALAANDSPEILQAICAFPQIKILLLLEHPLPIRQAQGNGGPLVLSCGTSLNNAGLFSGQLDGQGQLISWNHEIISLDERHPPMSEVRDLIEQYKEDLGKEGILESLPKRSSPIGFIGSSLCGECHQETYEQWHQTRHAQAFDTLRQLNQIHNPECVSCHVVGFDYEEGFRSAELTPHLQHVGCEVCHGPGAHHLIDPHAPYRQTVGLQLCLQCHQPSKSPRFHYPTFREKIRH